MSSCSVCLFYSMSSVAVKENQGVCAVRKNSSSDESCDIFSLEQLTGRPSILRQSQADNINKAVLKGAKVSITMGVYVNKSFEV